MTVLRRNPRGDGDVTRSKILEAAGQLFAQSGYAETPSKAVATLAGVDLAAINYHFGGRGGLYQAVLIEGHRRLISLNDLHRIQESQMTAEEKLGLFIESLVDRIYSQKGWPIKVCAREMLSPSIHFHVLMSDGILPKSDVIRSFISSILEMPPEDPVVERCMVCVMAPCLMLLVSSEAAPPSLKSLLKQPSQSLADHLKRFIMAGLHGIRNSN